MRKLKLKQVKELSQNKMSSDWQPRIEAKSSVFSVWGILHNIRGFQIAQWIHNDDDNKDVLKSLCYTMMLSKVKVS